MGNASFFIYQIIRCYLYIFILVWIHQGMRGSYPVTLLELICERLTNGGLVLVFWMNNQEAWIAIGRDTGLQSWQSDICCLQRIVARRLWALKVCNAI
jgi:hypothetical protein